MPHCVGLFFFFNGNQQLKPSPAVGAVDYVAVKSIKKAMSST